MLLPDLKDLVRDGKRVTFTRCQSGELWYRCEGGFEFPVPVTDTGDAAFLVEDRASFFMRWIRKHLDFVKKSVQEQTAIV